MSTDYSDIKFAGYLSGGAWFPDEYDEGDTDRENGAVSNIRGSKRYVSPPAKYLEFPRWQSDIAK